MRMVLFILLGVSLLGGIASAQERHLISRLNSESVPSTPESMAVRIQEAATEYHEYAPVPRVVFYDIAYPADEAEAKRLKGCAVLLVTAISQDQAELPLRRVYVASENGPVKLALLASVSSVNSENNDPVGNTFGKYRSDSLYLLPLRLTFEKRELFADFAKNRDGFKLAELEGPSSLELKQWSGLPIEKEPPSEKSLLDFIQREYPGFVEK